MIRHTVFFQLKEELSDVLHKEFLALKNNVPEISAISGGTNISQEGFDKGFTHGYVLDFENKQSLHAYLQSEKHTEFIRTYVQPAVTDTFVFDYEV